ncbi:MAG: hypothetical protein K0Q90_4626, partial [Paenibacillaceae bacterium]|nr:hypothetical protein [Paenibacillaceae bacterium]
AYWNADGFCAEKASDNITYNRCTAFGNTDGGWDVKSYNTYLNDCVSYGNKRAYRFWSGGEAVVRNSVGYNSVEPGGMATACGVWAGIQNGVPANVFLYNSEIFNNAGPELRVEGGNIVCTDCIVSEGRQVTEEFTSIDPVKQGSITLTDTMEYYPGAPGTNPQALLKDLAVTPGSLAFSPETVTYTVYAASGTASVQVNAAAASMVIQDLLVNGASTASGSARIIPLAPGANDITIEVVAFDGTRETYLIRVIR